MRIFLLTLVSALLVATGCGGNKSSWKKVTGKDNWCTIEMPGPDKVNEQKFDVPQGKIHVYMQECQVENGHFIIGSTSYPNGFLGAMGGSAELIFTQAIKATVTQQKAKIVKNDNVKFGEFPGRKVTMTLALGPKKIKTEMTQWLILAKGRMYIVQGMIPETDDAKADLNQFFDSFKFNVK